MKSTVDVHQFALPQPDSPRPENIEVRSAGLHDRRVQILFGGYMVEVLASDLIAAVANATNNNKNDL